MKNTFFVIVVLLFATNLQSQTSLLSDFFTPSSIEKTIIREYVSPYTISYIKTKTDNYFCYSDETNTSVLLKTNSKLDVNDFVVDADSVFFCGTTTNGEGFLGYFDIYDFFFGSNGYSVDNHPITVLQQQISSLTKMVSYTDMNNVRNMVAIGTTSLGNYCIVNVYRTANGWDYSCGVLGTAVDENMLDIALTDSCVVTAGFSLPNSQNPRIQYRVYDRNAVLTNVSLDLCNTSLVYSDVSNQYSFASDQIAIKQATANFISIAAYWKYYNGSQQVIVAPEPQGTYIGLYQVHSSKQSNYNSGSILIPHSYVNGNWRLCGLTTCRTPNQSINLLNYIEHPTTHMLQSFVFELTHNIIANGITVPCRAIDTLFFQSIDWLNNSQYVMNGYKTATNTACLYNIGTLGANNCLLPTNLESESVSMLQSTVQNPYAFGFTTDLFNIMTATKQTQKISIDCMQ